MFKKDLVILMMACFVFIGCDDEESSSNNTNNTNLCGNFVKDANEICDGTDLGTFTCNGINDEYTGGELICNAMCSSYTTENCAGEDTDVVVNIHAGKVYVRISDYQNSIVNTDIDLTNCDIIVDHNDDGPNFVLCYQTSALVLGNDQLFHDVLEAPLDATYLTDDGTDYVIPNVQSDPDAWTDGGAGEDVGGYDMTQNIYILHLGDGSYAKMEVVHAEGGTVTTKFYRDPEGGNNLRTIPSVK
jgi:hypothetical protein